MAEWAERVCRRASMLQPDIGILRQDLDLTGRGQSQPPLHIWPVSSTKHLRSAQVEVGLLGSAVNMRHLLGMSAVQGQFLTAIKDMRKWRHLELHLTARFTSLGVQFASEFTADMQLLCQGFYQIPAQDIGAAEHQGR